MTGQYKKKDKKQKQRQKKKKKMLEKYTLTDMFKYQTCCISRDSGKWVVCVPFFPHKFYIYQDFANF